MARWDIFRGGRVRDNEATPPAEERHNAEGATFTVGRGPGEDSGSPSPERPIARHQERAVRNSRRRTEHRDRDKSYWLRSSEVAAMTDIGRFRAVDVRDLAKFVYSGDERRLTYDMESLRQQGLIEEKTLLRAHRSARKLVALTAQGERIVRPLSGLPKEQRLYHGFVKPKELDHDADLYKVYQRATEEIRAGGGKPGRVRIDFELKESINRARESASYLPIAERNERIHRAAQEQGLRVDGGRVHLPDMQLEYETKDGRLERENLELLSQNYREQGIRGKAAAGFRIYARSSDSARIRRALQDTGVLRQVMAL